MVWVMCWMGWGEPQADYLGNTMSLLPPNLPAFVPEDRYSIAAYLAIEQATGKRYEYHDGLLVSVEAMAGGSPSHALIGGHLIREVGVAIIDAEQGGSALQDQRCDSYTSNLRIAVDGGKRYLYADAVVVCGEPVYDEAIPTAVVSPLVVFEVLSPSSEGYDRGSKFDFYSSLSALREYVLVDQARRRVEVSTRAGAAEPWHVTVVTDPAGAVALPSLEVQLPMAGIYRNWQPPEL